MLIWFSIGFIVLLIMTVWSYLDGDIIPIAVIFQKEPVLMGLSVLVIISSGPIGILVLFAAAYDRYRG